MDREAPGFTMCAHKTNYTIHDQRAGEVGGPVVEREGGGHLLNKFTDDGVARTLTSQEGDVVGLRRRDGYF